MNCTVIGSCWSTVKKIQDIKYHRYSEICCEIWFKLITQFKSTYVHAGHSGTAQSFLSWILIHLLHLDSRQPWRMHICLIKLTTNINLLGILADTVVFMIQVIVIFQPTVIQVHVDLRNIKTCIVFIVHILLWLITTFFTSKW